MEVFFNSTAGRIEGQYNASNNNDGPVALILHPHPFHEVTANISLSTISSIFKQ